MVKSILVDVDFNGIVLFDYPGILTIFDGEINDGDNILNEFTNTDKGDIVLDKGIALPIMGIDDGTYLVRIFINENPEEKMRRVIFSDKYFYLNITGELYVADMAVFWDWENYLGWKGTGVPNGTYKVHLEGVQLTDENNETVYGYDLILSSVNEIGFRKIDPRPDSRIY